MSVVIETTIGDITVDLYLKERPNTCLNFLKLCKIKYYNLCLFHKVERNFIAQTGDPTSTGRGGESIFSHLYGDQAKYFDSELKPKMKHEKIGTLSMVNNGSNMNGSQFFLTLGENLTYLDEVHTVFGEVVEGFEILLKINESICDTNNRPYQDIRITHTVILHDPYDDPSGLNIPDASPIPTKEMLETDYIAPDEEIDDSKGKNTEEIEEKIKESEAKARATILEMVGDIPDADVKPPENVLFVCKLNPVTTSEDLELIFSRFGTIVSCEVIKDKKSGESLQYAFIEFEKEEDCENAYFKMDNVLIDDRRIHVDFSQSVSKKNWMPENRFSKQKSNKSQNYVLKDKERKSDGYEMIFDIDEESNYSRSKNKDEVKSDSHSSKRSKNASSHHNKPNYLYSSHNKKHRPTYSRSPSPVKSLKKSETHKSRSPLRQEYSSSSSHKNVKEYRRHDSASSDSSSVNRKQTELYSKDRNYKKSKDGQVSKHRNWNPSNTRSKNSHDSKFHTKHSSTRLLSKPFAAEHRNQVTSSSSESRSVSPDLQFKKGKNKDSNYSSSSNNYKKGSSRVHSKSSGASHLRSKYSPSSDSESDNQNKKRKNKDSSSSKFFSSEHYEKRLSRVHSKSSGGSRLRSKSSSSSPDSESVKQSKKGKNKDSNSCSSSKVYSSNNYEKLSSQVHSKSSGASRLRSKSSSSSESSNQNEKQKNKDSNYYSSSKIYQKHSSKVHSKSHLRSKSSSSSESVSPERYHKKKIVKYSKDSPDYKKVKRQSLSPEHSNNAAKVSYSSHKSSKQKERYSNSHSNKSDKESYTSKKINLSKSSSSKHFHKSSRNRRSSS